MIVLFEEEWSLGVVKEESSERDVGEVSSEVGEQPSKEILQGECDQHDQCC